MSVEVRDYECGAARDTWAILTSRPLLQVEVLAEKNG
jgi:hypothetical protein